MSLALFTRLSSSVSDIVYQTVSYSVSDIVYQTFLLLIGWPVLAPGLVCPMCGTELAK